MRIHIRPQSSGLCQWFDHAFVSFALGMFLLAIEFAERRAFTKET